MMRAQLVSTPGRGSSSLAALGVQAIARAWQTFWAWRAKRVTMELLASLDDRTLRDIGVSRGEIMSLVYGRRGDRRRCYDEAWRWDVGH